jgi:hypothetical protein
LETAFEKSGSLFPPPSGSKRDEIQGRLKKKGEEIKKRKGRKKK